MGTFTSLKKFKQLHCMGKRKEYSNSKEMNFNIIRCSYFFLTCILCGIGIGIPYFILINTIGANRFVLILLFIIVIYLVSRLGIKFSKNITLFILSEESSYYIFNEQKIIVHSIKVHHFLLKRLVGCYLIINNELYIMSPPFHSFDDIQLSVDDLSKNLLNRQINQIKQFSLQQNYSTSLVDYLPFIFNFLFGVFLLAMVLVVLVLIYTIVC